MEQIDSKTALLKAAEELFAEQGYAATSVKEICERAGVNISLVSYHFNGKEGLYIACLEQFAHAGMSLAESVLVTPKSREEFLVRLQMFAEEVVRKHVEQPNITRILHRECSMISPARDFFKKTFHKVFESLVMFITSAQTAGFARKDVNTMLASTFFFGSMSHLFNTDELRRDLFGDACSMRNEEFRKKAIENLIQIFVRGVML